MRGLQFSLDSWSKGSPSWRIFYWGNIYFFFFLKPIYFSSLLSGAQGNRSEAWCVTILTSVDTTRPFLQSAKCVPIPCIFLNEEQTALAELVERCSSSRAPRGARRWRLQHGHWSSLLARCQADKGPGTLFKRQRELTRALKITPCLIFSLTGRWAVLAVQGMVFSWR